MSGRPQFVLVHGAWHGAWCWSRVLPRLRAAGHDAHAVTLTGVGDRAHLLSRDIRIATHVADVVGLIVCEELADVVLVGHSYAGHVVTGVADRRPAPARTGRARTNRKSSRRASRPPKPAADLQSPNRMRAHSGSTAPTATGSIAG